MATIIADSPEGQLARLRGWLDARGGRWTRGLAMAALEGWRGRSEVAEPGQVQQLELLPAPHVPDLGAPARGDIWLLLRESVDGRRAELPEPSLELAQLVLRRFGERVRGRLPAPPSPSPSSSGIGIVGSMLLLWLIATLFEED